MSVHATNFRKAVLDRKSVSKKYNFSEGDRFMMNGVVFTFRKKLAGRRGWEICAGFCKYRLPINQYKNVVLID